MPFPHPQGCRGYVLADPESRKALALDVHLDGVAEAAARVTTEGWDLAYVVDTHTHADHPSGARKLADWFGATRVAHRAAGHHGVTMHPGDGDVLEVGGVPVRVLHAPGHTPDHLVLLAADGLFSGDTLLIGSVARTDFLGGDAGTLFDSIQRVTQPLPGSTRLWPGHDYKGRTSSTLEVERATNPWLLLRDRAEFAARLAANRPPRPPNMDDLLRWNREGSEPPPRVPASLVAERVRAGGGGSVIDVRTEMEHAAERVPGAHHVPLEVVEARADEVRAAPAPRFLLCTTSLRSAKAQQRLDALGVQALAVVEGGFEAYRAAGGPVEVEPGRMSLERQVRIGAGVLVATFALLGALVAPVLALGAALVGVGLVYAGVTNRCGMALLLAKAPWNRRPARPATAGCEAGGCAADAPSATPPAGPVNAA